MRLRTTKSDKNAKNAKPGAPAKPESKARKPESKPRKPESKPRPARRERHVMPFPIRLLAMLCAFGFMVAFAVVLARLTLEPSPHRCRWPTPICIRAAR